MNAPGLTLIASLLAFATAHAAGDEMPVETIVVTAKRPAFIEPAGTILVVTVRAPRRVVAPEFSPEVITVSPEDSVVLEPPRIAPVIEAPVLALPKISIAPPRIMLALAEAAPAQG
jgi:hypothetical protein